MEDKNGRYIVTVYVGQLSEDYEALSVEASKHTTAEEIVSCIVQKLGFPNSAEFELAEVIGNSVGQECKERRISAYESPVALKLLWPKSNEGTDNNKSSKNRTLSRDSQVATSSSSSSSLPGSSEDCYRFVLREKLTDSLWNESFVKDTQFIRDYFYRFHFQPKDKEYPDLCQLPDLNESTLLESLKSRFNAGHIYSYVGSILIAVNPFKFYPIYNPKYVKLYQNRRREELPPHIFSIADISYHTMLKEKRNQCIVISGESGSGKTESTNFLLHHLTALSQKGTHGSGVEQTILSAGPVLEAFGNAKTAHNNNSSRFGKFIQVSYRENGMVHGAIVQKFLLEKSRICCQALHERNYHVFYYLLAGANEQDKEELKLLPAHNYHYLNQSGCYTLEGVDESYEFSRLKQSMEMVGFGPDKQRKLFSVLSAVLLLGNVKFVPKKSSYHDESVLIKNLDAVRQISSLLRVKHETLLASLTSKRARVNGEMIVINYRMTEAVASRDALAKCLYGALFDWIVLQLNHALLSKKGPVGNGGKSIGVLDIFGFEDFDSCNSFEQYCINYANEHLQHYFNQHVFKYEQEEYKKEGIRWTNIEFLDNSPCLNLFEAKPHGLICILDDQCNFPGATSETLLQKFSSVYKDHKFYNETKRENAFVICHYAGRVKYQVLEFREKNMDLMRYDLIIILKNSSCAFVRELVSIDPVAVFRWAILRAFFRAFFAFQSAGRKRKNHPENNTFNRNLSVRSSSVISNNDHLVKKRSFRSQPIITRNMKNLRTVKTLASHLAAIGVSNKSYNPRKQPISVSQQFQQSLHSLMVTLNQANPFFIRCIKSNADKVSNMFDDGIVQRQLRYTGMLETVRIRQAGYNVRLNFDEFIHLYRILLPKGLKSEREDVEAFMKSLNLNPLNYQLGQNKVFMRETEKIKLDYFLHQQILTSIVCIQRWYRSILERRHFLRVQQAVITIQSYVRMFMAQRLVANLKIMNLAATYIQKMWRGHHVRKWYQSLRNSCIQVQARARGNFLRQRVASILEQRRRLSKEKDTLEPVIHPEPTTNEILVKSGDEIYNMDNISRGSFEELDGISVRKSKPKITSESNEFLHQSYTNSGNSEYINNNRTVPFRSKIGSDETLDYGDADDNANIYDSNINSDGKKDNNNKLVPMKSPSSKNPFHRAKKHIKTIMISNAKTKQPEKHEATLLEKLESGSENEDNNDNFSPNSRPSASFLPSSSSSKLKVSSSLTNVYPGETTSNSMLPKKSVLQLRHSRTLKNMVDNSNISKRIESPNLSVSKSSGRLYHHESESPFVEKAVDVPLSMQRNFPLKPFEKNTTVQQPKQQQQNVGKSGLERRGDNRKLQVYDDSYPNNNGLDAFRPVKQSLRRESDGVVSMNSCDLRRSSRDSAQSYSPSVSSQDSLFYQFNSNNEISTNIRPQERGLSASASGMSLPNSGAPLNPVSYSRKPLKAIVSSEGIHRRLALDVNSARDLRDVRRTRSVSETRGSNGDLEDGYNSREDFLLSDSTPESTPTAESGDNGKSIKFGYHDLDKCPKFHRGDSCKACKKNMHAVFAPGFRCSECKAFFHDKCVTNGAILNHICECRHQKNSFIKPTRSKSETISRRLKRKQSKTPVDVNKPKFSLTGTSEFIDAADQIISDVRELQKMQEFISAKIHQVRNKEGEKSSLVDKVFEQALMEFKESLVSTYSVGSKQGGIMQLNITYKDLIQYFANIMETVCKQEQADVPSTPMVNALRGFLNEFMSSNRVEEKPKLNKTRKKVKRTKRPKGEETINYLGHCFSSMVIYIPTACEICSSFIMWPIERGVSCDKCKLACHKKCHLKLQIECNEGYARGNTSGDGGIFGASLASLVTEPGTVPHIVDQLITVVEFYGLRQEGIYRKSGVSSSVKELKNEIKEGKKIDWETYSIHVLTAVLKSFFREMPEPLLTFELYDEFLRAADLSRQEDRVHTIFSILKKLPRRNYDLTERLIFHLVRVAWYEAKNRMNANSLAIVFAPCILRTNKSRQVQDSLNDISRQTTCVETIISEQLKKFKATLSNIEDVDTATVSFSVRLNSIRSSKMPLKAFTGVTLKDGEILPPPENMSKEEEEEYLQHHINYLKKKNRALTMTLPSLSRTPSDDEMIDSTDPEVESSAGSVDDLHRDSSLPSSSDKCELTSANCHECQNSSKARLQQPPTLLPQNVIKNKNRGPVRRLPSRFVRQNNSVDFGENEAEMYLNSDLEDSKDQSVDDEETILV